MLKAWTNVAMMKKAVRRTSMPVISGRSLDCQLESPAGSAASSDRVTASGGCPGWLGCGILSLRGWIPSSSASAKLYLLGLNDQNFNEYTILHTCCLTSRIS